VRRSIAAGDSVPQNGQMSLWRLAFHSAGAPFVPRQFAR
jgi:hypothetical protein